MPFRTPAFFRRREEQPAAPGRVDGDDAMLDAAPPPHAGAPAGAGRGDGDAHAAALAADVLPDKAAIGSALGSLGAPPLFPLLPREELVSDEERAVSLQGFGAFGCAAAKRGGKASHSLHRVVAGQYSRPRTPLPLRRCKHYHRRARLVVPCCKGEARGARGWRPRGAASSRAVARCLTLPLARLASARARRLSGAATATTSARTAPSAATATPSGAPRRPGARACARTPQLRAAPRRTAAPHAPHAPPSWHELDRKCVSDVQCALCHTVQPVAEACLACGTAFGRYTCLECRFFDDDVRKGQFHCDKCGICRVGGRDNFFHVRCPFDAWRVARLWSRAAWRLAPLLTRLPLRAAVRHVWLLLQRHHQARAQGAFESSA